MKRPRLAAVLSLSLLAAAPAGAEADALRVDWKLDLAVTAGAGALAIGLASPQLSPKGCRAMCTPGDLDSDLRSALRFSDPLAALKARQISDALVSGILPAGALGTAIFLARTEAGPRREVWENAIVISKAVALAAALNGVAKDTFARTRPAPADWHQPGSRNRSFYSGHTSMAFALAASSATVATIRGSPAAPWAWGVGMALASGVAYLRVAGDAHWASDVLVGAAVGGGIGFAVPWFLHRRPDALPPRVEIVPASAGRGLALRIHVP